jgi:hypothetical protein
VTSLTEKLLAKPVAPAVQGRKSNPDTDFTKQIELAGDSLTATLRGKPGEANEGTALRFIQAEGLNPAEWEATGFRRSEWDAMSGEKLESSRFTFKRVAAGSKVELLPEEITALKRYRGKAQRAQGDHAYIVAFGDMQFGKIDGDGVEGTIARALTSIDMAADLLAIHRKRFDIGHVHVAWMGDHIEGFVSQGGANVWRTQLTLNEQIRLSRRVMLHALTTFADQAEVLTMAAVPGNHGETIRLAGKGITRYDDSHDTESLIAVADAAALHGNAFEHVKFYVPQTDEMTVVLDLAGTITAHVHGHQYRPGKHWEWWRGQAFGRSVDLQSADLLLAGHLHHEFMDSDGPRMFLQVPALESESTWWRHATGTPGNPGLLTAVTSNGQTRAIEVLR